MASDDPTHPPGARAAVITPPGEGGIGIIAVLGPRAAEVLDRVFVGTKRAAADIPSGGIAHGTIRRDGEVVDEVIVARPTPDEDAAKQRFEVNCHGGTVAVATVLKCLEAAGATVVNWRELTPKTGAAEHALGPAAIRAAALAALPDAPTRLAVTMLLHQADGAVARALARVQRSLAENAPAQAAADLEALLATASFGRALLQPPSVALLGPPNVGKSTLLNALLERERGIVHHEPGTTRDVLRELVSLRGMPFELMDMAGIRRADDELERHAVRRAADAAQRCDVALLMFDAREGPQQALAALPAPSARIVLVANKTDLLSGERPPCSLPPDLAGTQLVHISARDGAGVRELESALLTPYRDMLERCREGCAVLFTFAMEAAALDALRQVHEGRPDAALYLLD